MRIIAECPYCREEINGETYENHGTWVNCKKCELRPRVTVFKTETGEVMVKLSVVGKPNQGLVNRYQIMLSDDLYELVKLCGPHIVRSHLYKLRNYTIVPPNK